MENLVSSMKSEASKNSHPLCISSTEIQFGDIEYL